MKFERREPKVIWSKEKTQKQIDTITEEMRDLSREINNIQKQISHLGHCKKIFQEMHGNKQIYRDQLLKQLNEIS